MQEEEYLWMLGVVSAYRQQFDEDPDDPLSRAMQEVSGLLGRLRHHERQSANEALVAALILVLIYAWTCAKYRVRIGVFDKNRTKILQNPAAEFSPAYFALSLAITAFPEITSQFSASDTLCQINRPLTTGRRSR